MIGIIVYNQLAVSSGPEIKRKARESKDSNNMHASRVLRINADGWTVLLSASSHLGGQGGRELRWRSSFLVDLTILRIVHPRSQWLLL